MNNEDQAELEISDISGRKVFYKLADKGQYEVPIDLTRCSRGSYIVELKINHVLVARNKLLLIKN